MPPVLIKKDTSAKERKLMSLINSIMGQVDEKGKPIVTITNPITVNGKRYKLNKISALPAPSLIKITLESGEDVIIYTSRDISKINSAIGDTSDFLKNLVLNCGISRDQIEPKIHTAENGLVQVAQIRNFRNGYNDPKPNEDSLGHYRFKNSNIDFEKLFEESFHDVNETVKDDNSGSTFCGVIYDPKTKKITVGNLGDSRAYLRLRHKTSGKEILVSLSEDFKPVTARFKARIKNNGGVVIPHKKDPTEGYLNDDIMIAGGIGDDKQKGIIKSPDIITFTSDDFAHFTGRGFEFQEIIVTSDGFTSREKLSGGYFDELWQLSCDEPKAGIPISKTAKSNISRRRFVPVPLEKTLDRESGDIQDMIYAARCLNCNDDITAVSLKLESLRPGELPIFIAVADGHGKPGNTVSQRAMDKMLTCIKARDRETAPVLPSRAAAAQPMEPVNSAATASTPRKQKPSLTYNISSIEDFKHIPDGTIKLIIGSLDKPILDLVKLPTLPDSIEEITINGAPNLNNLGTLPQKLITLRLCGCLNLEALPILPDKRLKHLHLECPKLKMLPRLPNCINYLNLGGCTALTRDNIAKLEELETVGATLHNSSMIFDEGYLARPEGAAGIFRFGFRLIWPEHLDRTTGGILTAVNKLLQSAYKERYKDNEDFKDIKATVTDQVSYPTYCVFNRFMTEAKGVRGTPESLASACMPMAQYISEHPGILKFLDSISGIYLTACINQPVKGFSELATLIEIAQQDNILSKLEIAKRVFIVALIDEEVRKSGIGSGVEVELGNLLYREVHKRLLEEKTITKAWPGVPTGNIAYEDTVKGKATPAVIQRIYEASQKILESRPDEQLINYLGSGLYAPLWSYLIIGEDDYKKINNTLVKLREAYTKIFDSDTAVNDEEKARILSVALGKTVTAGQAKSIDENALAKLITKEEKEIDIKIPNATSEKVKLELSKLQKPGNKGKSLSAISSTASPSRVSSSMAGAAPREKPVTINPRKEYNFSYKDMVTLAMNYNPGINVSAPAVIINGVEFTRNGGAAATNYKATCSSSEIEEFQQILQQKRPAIDSSVAAPQGLLVTTAAQPAAAPPLATPAKPTAPTHPLPSPYMPPVTAYAYAPPPLSKETLARQKFIYSENYIENILTGLQTALSKLMAKENYIEINLNDNTYYLGINRFDNRFDAAYISFWKNNIEYTIKAHQHNEDDDLGYGIYQTRTYHDGGELIAHSELNPEIAKEFLYKFARDLGEADLSDTKAIVDKLITALKQRHPTLAHSSAAQPSAPIVAKPSAPTATSAPKAALHAPAAAQITVLSRESKTDFKPRTAKGIVNDDILEVADNRNLKATFNREKDYNWRLDNHPFCGAKDFPPYTALHLLVSSLSIVLRADKTNVSNEYGDYTSYQRMVTPSSSDSTLRDDQIIYFDAKFAQHLIGEIGKILAEKKFDLDQETITILSELQRINDINFSNPDLTNYINAIGQTFASLNLEHKLKLKKDEELQQNKLVVKYQEAARSRSQAAGSLLPALAVEGPDSYVPGIKQNDPILHSAKIALQYQKDPALMKRINSQLDANIQSVTPVVNAEIFELMRRHIALTMNFGTAVEEACYTAQIFNNTPPATKGNYTDKNISDDHVRNFIMRLINKRPFAFLNSHDDCVLRDGSTGTQTTYNFAELPLKPTPNPTNPHFTFENYISYDEMKFSAYLSVHSKSVFVNDGGMANVGNPGAEGSYQKEGYIIGAVGARLEKPGYMEYQDAIVVPDDEERYQGRITDPNSARYIGAQKEMWCGFFFGRNDDGSAKEKYPTTSQAIADTKRYVAIGKGKFLDTVVYQKILEARVTDILLRANSESTQEQKGVVVLQGLGMGNWLNGIDTKLPFYQLYINTVKQLARKLALPNIAKIEMPYIGNILNHEETINNIAFSKTTRNCLIPRDSKEKLFVAFAWDSASMGGNEFWKGDYRASMDPATACAAPSALYLAGINEHIKARKIEITGEEVAHVYGAAALAPLHAAPPHHAPTIPQSIASTTTASARTIAAPTTPGSNIKDENIRYLKEKYALVGVKILHGLDHTKANNYYLCFSNTQTNQAISESHALHASGITSGSGSGYKFIASTSQDFTPDTTSLEDSKFLSTNGHYAALQLNSAINPLVAQYNRVIIFNDDNLRTLRGKEYRPADHDDGFRPLVVASSPAASGPSRGVATSTATAQAATAEPIAALATLAGARAGATAAASTPKAAPELTIKEDLLQEIKRKQLEIYSKNFEPVLSGNKTNIESIRQHVGDGFDWWIFPSSSRANPRLSVNQNTQEGKQLYTELSNNSEYCKRYVDCINIYLDNHTDSTPVFRDRFAKLRESLLGITFNNTRILAGIATQTQNTLFQKVSQFERKYNLTATTQADYHTQFSTKLAEIVARIPSPTQAAPHTAARPLQQTMQARAPLHAAAPNTEPAAATKKEASKTLEDLLNAFSAGINGIAEHTNSYLPKSITINERRYDFRFRPNSSELESISFVDDIKRQYTLKTELEEQRYAIGMGRDRVRVDRVQNIVITTTPPQNATREIKAQNQQTFCQKKTIGEMIEAVAQEFKKITDLFAASEDKFETIRAQYKKGKSIIYKIPDNIEFHIRSNGDLLITLKDKHTTITYARPANAYSEDRYSIQTQELRAGQVMAKFDLAEFLRTDLDGIIAKVVALQTAETVPTTPLTAAPLLARTPSAPAATQRPPVLTTPSAAVSAVTSTSTTTTTPPAAAATTATATDSRPLATSLATSTISANTAQAPSATFVTPPQATRPSTTTTTAATKAVPGLTIAEPEIKMPSVSNFDAVLNIFNEEEIFLRQAFSLKISESESYVFTLLEGNIVVSRPGIPDKISFQRSGGSYGSEAKIIFAYGTTENINTRSLAIKAFNQAAEAKRSRSASSQETAIPKAQPAAGPVLPASAPAPTIPAPTAASAPAALPTATTATPNTSVQTEPVQEIAMPSTNDFDRLLQKIKDPRYNGGFSVKNNKTGYEFDFTTSEDNTNEIVVYITKDSVETFLTLQKLDDRVIIFQGEEIDEAIKREAIKAFEYMCRKYHTAVVVPSAALTVPSAIVTAVNAPTTSATFAPPPQVTSLQPSAPPGAARTHRRLPMTPTKQGPETASSPRRVLPQPPAASAAARPEPSSGQQVPRRATIQEIAARAKKDFAELSARYPDGVVPPGALPWFTWQPQPAGPRLAPQAPRIPTPARTPSPSPQPGPHPGTHPLSHPHVQQQGRP